MHILIVHSVHVDCTYALYTLLLAQNLKFANKTLEFANKTIEFAHKSVYNTHVQSTRTLYNAHVQSEVQCMYNAI